MTTEIRGDRSAKGCPRLAADTPEFAEHFYETLRAAQVQCPVAWDVTHERPVIVGYDAAAAAAKDTGAFSSAGSVSGVPDSEFRLIPVECDPPSHRHWRELLAPWFSPQAVVEMNDLIRGTVNELIDGFVANGACEAVAELARPLPARVIFQHLLRLPPDDLRRCVEYVEMFVGADMQGRMDAVTKLGLYSFGHIQKRRAGPAVDDLIGSIIGGDIGGEQVSDAEAASALLTLIVGALETTKSAIASAFLHFATHRVDQDAIASDRSLLGAAIEECLRLYTPATYLVRQVTHDVEIAGVSLRGGSSVAISFAATGRDPTAFDEPDSFRLDRTKNRHFGFGVGPHYCIGAHLARSMMTTVLDVALDRMSAWRLAPDWVPRWEVAGVRSLEALELVFDPPAGT
ncbi:MAG: cytochrome P450 [Solirubrobacteraceae bacterium]